VERVASCEAGKGGEPTRGAPVDGEFSTVDDAWGWGKGKKNRVGKEGNRRSKDRKKGLVGLEMEM
jgi:hypothetical protein